MVLISYSLLVTTSIFIFLVIFHVHIIGNRLVFHVHDFHSDIISDISSFEIDFIAMLVIGWCLSLIYSALIISQLALRLLNKSIIQSGLSDIDPINMLPQETKALLQNKNILVKTITIADMGLIFSLSYYSFFKKNNFIYVHESIFSLYSPEEYNAALIHEIGHIYNMDTIFFPVFNTLCKLMFFDPLLRKISNQYRDKMEEKADFFALERIDNSKNLAKAILRSVEIMNNFHSGENSHVDSNTSILSLKSSDKRSLTLRIEKIVNYAQK